MEDKSFFGGGFMSAQWSRVSIIILVGARAAPKENVLLALSRQAVREAFVN